MKSMAKKILLITLTVCFFSAAAVCMVQGFDTVTYSRYQAGEHETVAETIEIVDTIIHPDSIVATFNETYNCGDQFEINVVTRPTISGVVNRDTGKDFPAKLPDGRTVYLNPVYESARNEDNGTLFVMRIKFRNLTHKSFAGVKKSSFMLSGYVRNRRISYYPVMVQHYDWLEGNWSLESGWDIESRWDLTLQPLRELDLLVIFQVHPFLYNWELTVSPEPYDYYEEPESFQFTPPVNSVYNPTFGKSKPIMDAGGTVITYPTVEPKECSIVLRLTEVMNTTTDTVMKTIPNP